MPMAPRRSTASRIVPGRYASASTKRSDPNRCRNLGMSCISTPVEARPARRMPSDTPPSPQNKSTSSGCRPRSFRKSSEYCRYHIRTRRALRLCASKSPSPAMPSVHLVRKVGR